MQKSVSPNLSIKRPPTLSWRRRLSLGSQSMRFVRRLNVSGLISSLWAHMDGPASRTFFWAVLQNEWSSMLRVQFWLHGCQKRRRSPHAEAVVKGNGKQYLRVRFATAPVESNDC